MITYGDIYDAARKERYSDQIQPLPKNFLVSVADYLREKKQLSLGDEDILSDSIMKTKKQLENAVTLFRELIIRRRKKILNLVLIASETGISKKNFENMLDFEKILFEELMKNVEKSDRKVNEVLKGKKDDVLKHEMVLFNEDVGEFLDLNGERMGPFEKGQIANIPKEAAKILVESGSAEIVER